MFGIIAVPNYDSAHCGRRFYEDEGRPPSPLYFAHCKLNYSIFADLADRNSDIS